MVVLFVDGVKFTKYLKMGPACVLLPDVLLLSVLFLVHCVTGDNAFAENAKPDKYFSIKHNRISWADLPNGDLADINTGAKTRVKETGFDSVFAKTTNGTSSWSFGTNYAYTRYLYDRVNSRHRDLHSITFPVTYTNQADQFACSFHLSPGIATSSNAFKDPLNRLEAKDLVTTGGFSTDLAVGKNWIVLLGARYDYRFGESKLYPIAGIVLSASENLTLRLAYPDSLFSVRFDDSIQLFTLLYPAGNQWHVHTDDFQQEFTYNAEGWRVETGLRWNIRQPLAVLFSAGYEFERHIGFDEESGVRLSSKIDNNIFFSVELEIALN